MTSTPSVRTDEAERQGPIAPDRMTLVEDWKTPGGVRIELYADRKHGDGYLIACASCAPEKAADITGATSAGANFAWVGSWADRDQTWRNAQAAVARMHLATWQATLRDS